MENRFSGITNSTIREKIDEIKPVTDSTILRRILSFLDLTSLNITDNEKNIGGLCEKINNFPYLFPDLKGVAAICVYPRFIPLVRDTLKIQEVNIASVGASFPSSQTFLKNKIEECKMIIDSGADEIDIVISVGEFLAGNSTIVSDEISAIKDTIGCTHLKVILETGILADPDKIYSASMLAMEAGTDFIKTSTGKAPVSATPEAAWVMCEAIKDYSGNNNRMVGFKPAGGISVSEDAALYYAIVKTVLGNDWLHPDHFRIGASRLANDLLSDIEGREIKYF